MSLSTIAIDHVEYSVVLPIEETENPYAIAVGYDGGYAFPQGLVIAETVMTEDGELCPVRTIGVGAFSGCKAEKVAIPPTVRVISPGAFANSQVRVVEGAAGVRIISRDAFSNAESLVSYPFCKGLREIESCAFEQTALKRVCLPDYIKSVSVSAFDNLSLLSMPSTVELVPDRGVTRLDARKVELRGSGGKYRLEGRFLLTADEDLALWVDGPEEPEEFGEPYELVVPSCVKKMAAGALQDCSDMRIRFGNEKSPTLRCSHYVVDNECDTSEITFYGKGSLKIDQWNSSVFIRLYGSSPRLEVHKAAALQLEIAVDPSPEFYDNLIVNNYYDFSVCYLNGVKTVPLLLPGENVMGKDVTSIGKIYKASVDPDAALVIGEHYPYEFTYRVDLTQCEKVPQLLYPDPERMRRMELVVPEGMIDAYASHHAWGMAACITDHVSAAQNIAERNKKSKMLYAMAGSAVKTLAKANFGAVAKIDEGGAAFAFDFTIACCGLDLRVSGRTLPCADPDCWDRLCSRVVAVHSFVTGRTEQL